jgi:heme a synthase
MRRAADAALFWLVAIVVTGATVRLTGSGLGCPNWPSCTGARPVPELEYHAVIEFFNRLVSFPTLVATLAAWWVARRLHTPRPDLRLGSTLMVVGVLTQVVLGGLTVRLELPPLVVSAHFLFSVAILAAATFTSLAARSPEPVTLRAPLGPLAVATSAVMLLSLLAVIVAGVATTAAGPHSGAAGTGQVVPRLDGGDLSIMLHARGAYAFAGLLLLLVIWRVRTRAGLHGLGLLAVLVGLQVALGELQYRNGLPWEVVLAHVTNATVLWVVACRVAAMATLGTGAPERRTGDPLPGQPGAVAEPALPAG